MKFVKTIVTVAAISLLTVPAMAGNSAVQNENGNQSICQCSAVGNLDCQLYARGGKGNGGGRGGHGPGNGTGNGGNGPKDGTGNGSKTGTCVNS